MRRVTDLLYGAIDQKEVLRAARANIALRQWPQIVGEKMTKYCAVSRFERGTLWVAVTGAAWASELRLIKDDLLEKLNEVAGEPLFESLRIGVRPAEIVAPVVTETKPEIQREDLSHLSIQEIALRRLREWKDDSAS